jgi:hypothetical protein
VNDQTESNPPEGIADHQPTWPGLLRATSVARVNPNTLPLASLISKAYLMRIKCDPAGYEAVTEKS